VGTLFLLQAYLLVHPGWAGRYGVRIGDVLVLLGAVPAFAAVLFGR
jgi:hypothetical protein